MSIVLLGSTSGSCTLQEQAVAGTTVLTLPTVSGTIITTGSPQSGSVLQVVSQQAGQTVTSTSGSVTLLSQSFTPTSATSKVLMHANFCVERLGGGTGNYLFGNFSRNGSVISVSGMSTTWMNAPGYQLANGVRSTGSNTYLDSPATTSAITYSIGASFTDSGNVPWQFYILNLTLMEIAA